MRLIVLALFSALAGCATPPRSLVPVADHHQHLFSPAILAFSPNPAIPKPLQADDVVALLDQLGIRRGVLLSLGYQYGRPTAGPAPANEEALVRAENDWTAGQAARHPQRLVAFCGVNPLKDYAVVEVERCAKAPVSARGIKLHLGNSDVQLENPDHARRVADVFRAANRNGLAIAVHMRASISRQRPYGAEQARVFIDTLLAAAPDITVQVAHLASAGPGYDDPPAHAAMAVLADAVQKGDPRTRRLVFDAATNVAAGTSPADLDRMARFIRQVGVDRVLYGTDAAAGDNPRPKESWALFQRLPLTQAEFARIAANVAPYLR